MEQGKWIYWFLSAVLLVLLLRACFVDSEQPIPASGYAVTFTHSQPPLTDYDRSILYSTSAMNIITAENRHTFPLSYRPLFHTTDIIPSGAFAGQPYGAIIGSDNQPVYDPRSPLPRQFIADTPDGNTLVRGSETVPGSDSALLKLTTHFEFVSRDGAGIKQYQMHPVFYGLSTLRQNLHDGELELAAFTKLPMHELNGVWTPCAASLSPWQTHLGSEEYEPDALHWAIGDKGRAPGWESVPKLKNFVLAYELAMQAPYHYGFVPEVNSQDSKQVEMAKHYSLGRFSHESIVVMPDNKTAYMGDDAKHGALFMTIADRAGDLSANTLYAGKWQQKSGEGEPGGEADLQWISLGHASDGEIEAVINQGISFSDLFEIGSEEGDGFTPVQDRNGKVEYLRLKPGMEQAAAFLESRRYAAYLGATVEFSHTEGLAFDEQGRTMFAAISKNSYQMQDEEGDIRLAYNESGGIYTISLADSGQDRQGENIPSRWVADSIRVVPELMGHDLRQESGELAPDEHGNLADVNRIANPDNLSFSPALRTLFIAEDSDLHLNNFVWAWQVDSGKLSRIMSLPMGAEATGLQVIDDMNGYMYILCNYQHPGAASKSVTPERLQPVKDANPAFAAGIELKAAVGLIAIDGMPRNAMPWMQTQVLPGK